MSDDQPADGPELEPDDIVPEQPTTAAAEGGDGDTAESALEDGTELLDDGDELRRAIEAIVMVSDEPVASELLAQLLEISVPRVDEICRTLALDYEASGRGFQFARVAGGYRFQSHPDQSEYVERFVLDGRTARLSPAGLETLAIVAYKQPISRAQVAAIRGVNVDGVMRTLTTRGYVEEVGRDPGPGNAVLYGTTAQFLQDLGVDSLDDLPPLSAFLPDVDTVEALERSLRLAPEDSATEASMPMGAPESATDGDDSAGPAPEPPAGDG